MTKQLLFISPEQLFKPRELKELGFVEIPVGQAKRPEVEDISLQEFDRFLQLQRAGLEEKRELSRMATQNPSPVATSNSST